ESLIRALEHLPGWTLHIASRIDGRREAQLRALIPDRATVVFHRGISDADYAHLLDEATALVTASKEEGFGLPVIEAMAQGVPVAVSDIPIFREIAAEAAMYFDPDDPQSIAEAITALTDETIWAQQSAAGRTQSQVFDWSRSAQALIDVIRSVDERRGSGGWDLVDPGSGPGHCQRSGPRPWTAACRCSQRCLPLQLLSTQPLPVLRNSPYPHLPSTSMRHESPNS